MGSGCCIVNLESEVAEQFFLFLLLIQVAYCEIYLR
jgi:hypothetical protein